MAPAAKKYTATTTEENAFQVVEIGKTSAVSPAANGTERQQVSESTAFR